ncbi:MAG: hypothetical protein C7B46_00680 [Sulfobacillus benefaciens]|uniref:Peptidase S11 D-alanyl-D-alanine carboxypeptidase A N-terminal domain-containing protein n=1 Tax=Sulfobacillus benefaciens TaxID=453960 RepID=A0A2T2XM26_9FIRM|nr:MAG: hypothetical protein C7B46_00680 [Sulfobacillus benefaciens]
MSLTGLIRAIVVSTTVGVHSPMMAPSVHASSAILIQAHTGQILYAKNIRKEWEPASLTKIITAWLAIRMGWGQTVVISKTAQNQPGASLGLRAGQRIPMPSLVPAMMMASGNDAAYAIGQTVTPRERQFVSLMNHTAEKWHAVGVHFVNDTGLYAPSQHVTALGMAVISRQAMKNPTFRHIVALPYAFLPQSATKVFFNQNPLIGTYSGAIGIKIGYTPVSGENLAGAALRHGQCLIVILLHDNPADVWTDADALLSWGFQHH